MSPPRNPSEGTPKKRDPQKGESQKRGIPKRGAPKKGESQKRGIPKKGGSPPGLFLQEHPKKKVSYELGEGTPAPLPAATSPSPPGPLGTWGQEVTEALGGLRSPWGGDPAPQTPAKAGPAPPKTLQGGETEAGTGTGCTPGRYGDPGTQIGWGGHTPEPPPFFPRASLGAGNEPCSSPSWCVAVFSDREMLAAPRSPPRRWHAPLGGGGRALPRAKKNLKKIKKAKFPTFSAPQSHRTGLLVPGW